MAAMAVAFVSFLKSAGAPERKGTGIWSTMLCIAIFAVLATRGLTCARGDCSRRANLPPATELIVFALGANIFFLWERLTSRRRLLVEDLPWVLAQAFSSIVLIVYVCVLPG